MGSAARHEHESTGKGLAAVKAGAGLAPPREMAPPGGCRGAVSGWPKLLAAVDALSDAPAAAAQLRSVLGPGAGLGGPAALLAALAANPSILQGERPPADIYGHFVWFSLRVSRAASRIGAGLTRLPDLWTPALGADPKGIGALARALIAGPDGMRATAAAIADLAEAYRERLGGAANGLKPALKAFGAAGAALEKRATAAAGVGKDPDAARAAAALAGQRLRRDLEEYERDGAAVTATAVLANLVEAIEVMRDAWRAAADVFAAAAKASDAQLGDLAYVSGTLKTEESATEWREFAQTVKDYVQKLLILY